MTSRWITIDVDGQPMRAFLAEPRKPGSGVLVLQEIFGVNAHIQDVCRRLAGAGHTALAPEIYHRAAPGLQLLYGTDEVTRGKDLKDKVQHEELVADLAAAAAELGRLAPGPLGVMGFCFGGFCTVVAMTILPFAAGAAFYGGGIPHGTAGIASPLGDLGEIRGELLAVFGAQDALIPAADVQATRAALVQADIAHEVVVFENAGHGFFCDLRTSYRPGPASRAWDLALALFERRLK